MVVGHLQDSEVGGHGYAGSDSQYSKDGEEDAESISDANLDDIICK